MEIIKAEITNSGKPIEMAEKISKGKISKFLNEISDNLSIVNKLIIGAYLQFNNIQVKNNKLILSCIQGNDKQTIDYSESGMVHTITLEWIEDL